VHLNELGRGVHHLECFIEKGVLITTSSKGSAMAGRQEFKKKFSSVLDERFSTPGPPPQASFPLYNVLLVISKNAQTSQPKYLFLNEIKQFFVKPKPNQLPNK